MAERINPVVKAVLEWGPIAAFFLGYVKLKDETFTVAGTDYQGSSSSRRPSFR